MNWLRLYHSTLDSRKIQGLPDREFKAWVNMLIVASKNTPRGALPSFEDLAFKLRLRVDFVERLVSKFQRERIVDELDGVLYMHDWVEHQFKSDDVNQRVAKHREAERNVTGNVSGNVTRNVRDTDTDTDTDKKKTSSDDASSPLATAITEAATKIHDRHPARRRAMSAEAIGERLKKICKHHGAKNSVAIDLIRQIDKNHAGWCATEDWTKEDGQFANGLKNWLSTSAEAARRYLQTPPPPARRRGGIAKASDYPDYAGHQNGHQNGHQAPQPGTPEEIANWTAMANDSAAPPNLREAARQALLARGHPFSPKLHVMKVGAA